MIQKFFGFNSGGLKLSSQMLEKSNLWISRLTLSTSRKRIRSRIDPMACEAPKANLGRLLAPDSQIYKLLFPRLASQGFASEL